MKKISGSTQILIAMIAGVVAGFFLGEKGALFAPLGDIFILLIKMVIIPLVFFSIISGAAALGETKSAGRVGLFTVFYYMATSAVSVILGLVAGGIFKMASSLGGALGIAIHLAIYGAVAASTQGNLHVAAMYSIGSGVIATLLAALVAFLLIPVKK